MPNCGFDEYPEEIEVTGKQTKRPPNHSPRDESKSREYNSEEFGQHPFGRKQIISSTNMPMMGTDDWERWEEGNNEGSNENEMGEDGQSFGVNIEEMADSSHHQIHYGSHLGQNGAQTKIFSINLLILISILYHFIFKRIFINK